MCPRSALLPVAFQWNRKSGGADDRSLFDAPSGCHYLFLLQCSELHLLERDVDACQGLRGESFIFACMYIVIHISAYVLICLCTCMSVCFVAIWVQVLAQGIARRVATVGPLQAAILGTLW